MADVMEHVAYLSQEIGPRPAGTEEEQQAALYITEHMQKEAGLSAVIEDFTGVSNNELPRAICSAVTLVFTILALLLPVVALPAAQVGDAGVQRDAIDPGAEAASVFKCPVAFPQVVHRLLIEVGEVFLVLRIQQAHLVDDGLVLQQQVGEFFFLVFVCHFSGFLFSWSSEVSD